MAGGERNGGRGRRVSPARRAFPPVISRRDRRARERPARNSRTAIRRPVNERGMDAGIRRGTVSRAAALLYSLMIL